MTKAIKGGCLCKAIRYEITGETHSTCHCHCRACRHTTGAVAVTWTTVAIENFHITSGEPTLFASTKWGERQFCDQCGSQITFQHADFNRYIDVTVNTLDKPDAEPPERHIWTRSHVSWMKIDEHLPKSRED